MIEGFLEEANSRFIKRSGVKSRMHVPRIAKICINVGVGSAKYDQKLLESTLNDLSLIAGQRAVVTYAKKSIASFKLRKGFPVGVKVTLRRVRMFHFLFRLLYVVLPEKKDFLGFNMRNFGSTGNLSFGLKEHIAFPEINYDKVYKIFGMNVTMATTAVCSKQARLLFECFDFPFRD